MTYFFLLVFITIPIVLFIYLLNYEDERSDLGGFGGRKK